MTLLDLCAGDTYLQRTAKLFRSRPHQEIPWYELAQVGGALAWRTRVAECRTVLGMHIPKPRIAQSPNGVKCSFYKYVPEGQQ